MESFNCLNLRSMAGRSRSERRSKTRDLDLGASTEQTSPRVRGTPQWALAQETPTAGDWLDLGDWQPIAWDRQTWEGLLEGNQQPRGEWHRKPGPSGKSPYCKAAQLGISKESEKENALMKSGPEKRTDFFRG